MTSAAPSVMCVAELDPTGGGGIAADIETLCSLACHCTPIITAISIQDTQDLKDSAVVDSLLLIEQMRAVLEDIDVAAIKLHQLGSTSHIEGIHTVLSDYPARPVIVDPALWAFPVEADFGDALCALLLPHTSLLVLTETEAYELAGAADTLTACAHELLDMGAEHVLISSEPGLSKGYSSSLYGHSGLLQTFSWQQLPHNFVGAGSTFAAAITAYVAHGVPLASAIRQAQEYTWRALANARRIGMGRLIPSRFFSTEG
ncbi:MAG: hydroxymethylpyrimidine/phosphomethylpyrimidine kinase [Halieaceae bacterium]